MTRILVEPSELQAAGEELRRASHELRTLADRLSRAFATVEWESHLHGQVEGEVVSAARHCEALLTAVEALAEYLSRKAQVFEEADAAGAADIGRLGGMDPGQFQGGIARMPLVHAVGSMLKSLGEVVGAHPFGLGLAPLASGLPWLVRQWPDLFGKAAPVGGSPGITLGGASSEGRDAGATTPQPAAPVSAPEDAFWQGVGTAPVVEVDGQKRFNPTFQKWADQFNASVAAKWSRNSSDGVGNTGADNLTGIYALTPEKMEQLWDFSKQNHVDPRLMLAILKQEGTGSFNTNPANSAQFDGHGPQPAWDKDMTAALDGPIMAKLRLYPKAVEGGFKGTWVQWVNWYTPIDTPYFQGGPGVYAADIHWAAGVESNYRDVAKEFGGSQGDPVQAYGAWMGEHNDLFKPKNIDGDFEIRMGLPPGEHRPELALSKESAEPPYPDARDGEDGFWYFPGPDEYCWHIVKKSK
jgi:uncharacterized protein YukE